MSPASRYVLDGWIIEALRWLGGSATIVEMCKRVWERHQSDLQNSGELFYTWQYDIRWAANRLRRERKLKAAEVSPRGVWEIG